MAPKGQGQGAPGRGKGRGGGRGMGADGNCVCPNCGEKTPHERGIPCFDVKCPKCGTSMART